MKKILLAAAFTGMCALLSIPQTSAQTFERAIQEYYEQNGTTTYDGIALEPQGYRIGRLPKDLDGDGTIDVWVCCNEFWLFGIRIWSSSNVWYEFP